MPWFAPVMSTIVLGVDAAAILSLGSNCGELGEWMADLSDSITIFNCFVYTFIFLSHFLFTPRL
jgi:hypothetical protein